MKPSTTAGKASRMNIHCHPRRPIHPSVATRSVAEIGEPRKLEMGIATVNHPMMRARYSAGNQYVM
jgi:hypothetical protein